LLDLAFFAATKLDGHNPRLIAAKGEDIQPRVLLNLLNKKGSTFSSLLRRKEHPKSGTTFAQSIK
jgi:hypothetical protein